MELILGIGIITLFGKKIINNLKNTFTFLTLLIMSLALTFMYSIPYFLSLIICIILKYGIKDFYMSIKYLYNSLVRSKYRYKHRSTQKLVNILINCNYAVFILLTYLFIVKELIEPSLILNISDSIVLGIVIITFNKILSIIINKLLNKKIFFYKE